MKQRLVTQTDEGSQDNPIQKSNSFQNQFQIIQVVGNGTFGMVYLVLLSFIFLYQFQQKIKGSICIQYLKDKATLILFFDVSNYPNKSILQKLTNFFLTSHQLTENFIYRLQILNKILFHIFDSLQSKNFTIQKLTKKLLLKKEHLIIQELNHPCIVKLRQAYFTQGDNTKNADDIFLNLVMDYIPETLSKLIRNYRKNKNPFPNIQLKIYSYQMLRALAYLQGIGICHRDIKPQNILVNPNNHVLKICDFGSAKRLVPGEPNVAYICSRYYRAPELIFGATEYTTSIDIWSIGCVIVEMLTGEPLFPGESATDQLVEIIKILEFKFPQIKCHPWAKVFAKFKPEPLFIDFVSKLLVYSPKERLKPLEALLHPYFDEIRQQGFSMPNVKLPNFFDFQKEELQIQPEIAHKLIPSWFKLTQ